MPNRESKEGFTKFIFFQMADAFINNFMHPSFAPVCADKLINFHISLFQNLRHMNSNKKPSQINFL